MGSKNRVIGVVVVMLFSVLCVSGYAMLVTGGGGGGSSGGVSVVILFLSSVGSGGGSRVVTNILARVSSNSNSRFLTVVVVAVTGTVKSGMSVVVLTAVVIRGRFGSGTTACHSRKGGGCTGVTLVLCDAVGAVVGVVFVLGTV